MATNKTLRDISETAIKVFAGDPHVQLAYLFGSRVRGGNRPVQ